MRTAILLAGSLLVLPLTAQDPVDPKPESAPTAAERMQELQDLQRKAVADWRKLQAEAKNPEQGKVIKAIPMRPDFGPIAVKAKAFANEFAGTDDAVQFLLMVVQQGSDKAATRACLDTLMSAHIDSPKLSQMGQMIPYLDRIVDAEYAAQAMTKLMKSKSADVRGWAVFAKMKTTIEKADREGTEYADARAKLLAAAGEVDDQRLAEEIRGAIDMREKFGVGCSAPDIAGTDLDGVEFKLSDYKGKVIFLDFWGDW